MNTSWLENICSVQIDDMSSLPSVAITLFSIALFGGLMHCAFMCGPLVMSQLPARLKHAEKNSLTSEMSELTRLKGALMLPYHLGRLTTYVFLGGLFGLIGQSLSGLWQQIGGVLILVAGALILSSLLPPLKGLKIIRGENIYFPRIIQKQIKNLMQNPVGLKGYALGLLLGFIPCGMLYGALNAAAATSSPFSGMVLMAAFALGTIPALLMVAFMGSLAAGSIKKKFTPLAKGGTALAGVWLCYIGIRSFL